MTATPPLAPLPSSTGRTAVVVAAFDARSADDWAPPDDAWSRAAFATTHGAIAVRHTFGSDLTRGAVLSNYESASERATLAGFLADGLSRGEVVFEQASGRNGKHGENHGVVRDHLGFMDFVKAELEQLFDFLKDMGKSLGKKFVLVCLIDDLDRCLGGKNVKVS